MSKDHWFYKLWLSLNNYFSYEVNHSKRKIVGVSFSVLISHMFFWKQSLEAVLQVYQNWGNTATTYFKTMTLYILENFNSWVIFKWCRLYFFKEKLFFKNHFDLVLSYFWFCTFLNLILHIPHFECIEQIMWHNISKYCIAKYFADF